MDRDKNADKGREGFGDDQGTRVGSPDAGRGGSSAASSSQPMKEGLEGAILDGADTKRGTDEEGGTSTGAGAEAARGVHSVNAGRSEGGRVGDDVSTGASSTSGDAQRAGSEPLGGRTSEHKGGYGGEGGDPRTSSDKR